MKVRDVMTTSVSTVTPATEVRSAARQMAEIGVSALPVVDEQRRVVGIVSEGDLIHRKELGTARHRSWWLEMFGTQEMLARDYIESHAKSVRDVMTPSVISVTEDALLSDVAAILEKHNIKRVPVLRNGVLVGIVSRADLVKALAWQEAPSRADTDDAAIRNTFAQRLRSQVWVPAAYVSFTVSDGTISLYGLVGSEDQRQVLRVMAETIPGVRKVKNEVTLWRVFPLS